VIDPSVRAGIFGGSFDPPHYGHVLAALWALESGQIDRLLVIPVGRHAFGKQAGASFEHRLAMCRAAFARFGDAVIIDDREGRREGTTFAIDTLNELAAAHPNWTWRYLVGSDVAAEIATWRSGAEVTRIAPPLVVPRMDARLPIADQPGALPLVSSTVIRAALRSGSSTAHLLTAPVREYIAATGLYT
jgi:nicotinate-nucleotide adenylyltransferase